MIIIFQWYLLDTDILDIRMNAKEMWEAFSGKRKEDSYEAWRYGGLIDELAELTLQGVKTATASSYSMYLIEEEPIPQIGQYSIILNSKEEAVCIIQTKKVDIVPFHEVDEQHAYQEGEGDRSLAYWQTVHKEFFMKAMNSIDQKFDENMLVVCEKFQVVYPK